MPAYRLASRPVERIWGRRTLPPGFPAPEPGGEPIGEIWFEDPAGAEAELLVKYLFTSERLSVQVHPDDEAARAMGYPRGKDEAWYILGAEPGATIGLGLVREVTPEALRAAALDGSIERLLDWRPAEAGDIFYSTAGTIHAIGAGLSLIEIQQNLDLTFRLYDYGRPRELHLDQALAVARPAPWTPPFAPEEPVPGRTILAAGGAFVLERRQGDWGTGGDAVVVPLAAAGTIDGQRLEAGTVWKVEAEAAIEGADVLLAYPGAEPRASS